MTTRAKDTDTELNTHLLLNSTIRPCANSREDTRIVVSHYSGSTSNTDWWQYTNNKQVIGQFSNSYNLNPFLAPIGNIFCDFLQNFLFILLCLFSVRSSRLNLLFIWGVCRAVMFLITTEQSFYFLFFTFKPKGHVA